MGSNRRNWQGGRDNGARLPPIFSLQPTQEFPWFLFEESMITRPSGLIRPFIYESPPRFMDQRTMQVPTQDVESRLSQEQQKKALKKLKTEIYNPIPKMISKRVNFYYRDHDGTSYKEKELKGSDEDGKRCAICLEDFEPKEEVKITPCNHMFHGDCIVPWVKSHGQCPVCRFVLCEQRRESVLPLNTTTTTTFDANMDASDLLLSGLAEISRLINLNRREF